MDKRKLIKIVCIIVMFTIVFLSYGFSAFTNNMLIDEISANVIADDTIKVISNTIKANSVDTAIAYSTHALGSTNNGITLPYSDSYVVLDVGILNLGNVDLGLASISGINDGLKYEIVNDSYTDDGYQSYKLKDRLCADNNPSKCNLGSETHILIKISYESVEAYNNSSSKTFDVKLIYNFKKVYKVEYSQKVLKLLIGTPASYVTENDDISVKINFSDIDYISVTSSYVLTPNVDYFLADKTLSITNVKDNVYVGVNMDSYGGLTISSKWISSNSVEITLDGKSSAAFYIRLRDGDLYIGTAAGDLKNDDYIKNPLFKPGDNVYQEFEYLDGSCNLTTTITIKFRDATSNCAALDIAQFITNHATKTNFNPTDTYAISGPVETTVALSQLSFWTDKSNTFNNYKFKITYGKTN